MKAYIKRFSEITTADAPIVGIKNALLGDLCCNMSSAGINIPDGFALTTEAFRQFLSYNNLELELHELMWNLVGKQYHDIELAGSRARAMIMGAKIPPKVEEALVAAFTEYFGNNHQEVAVRSSISLKKGYEPKGSCPYDTFLNIQGILPLVYAIKCCYASLYTERAIKHRMEHGYAHDETYLSVGIQTMVRSDLAGSGLVSTSYDQPDTFNVSGSWGLGEFVTKGLIIPDQYTISKIPSTSEGFYSVEKVMGSKSRMIIYHDHAAGTNSTMEKTTPRELRTKFVISDDEAVELAVWAVKLSKYFSCHVDFEWAKDGITNKLYLINLQPNSNFPA
jgi:pyruvate,water dikinase